MAAKKKVLHPRPVLEPGARVVGIDLSLNSTGVAVIGPDGTFEHVGTVLGTTPHAGDLVKLYERLDAIFDGIEALVGGFRQNDLVIIEKALSHYSGAFGEVIANWHNVVGNLTRRGVTVIPIAPATRAVYGSGGGKSDKSQVVLQVERRFPTAKVANNDEADGVVLAAIGRHLAGCSIEPAPLPATHLSVDKLFEPLEAREMVGA